jgi:hypothetical protein
MVGKRYGDLPGETERPDRAPAVAVAAVACGDLITRRWGRSSDRVQVKEGIDRPGNLQMRAAGYSDMSLAWNFRTHIA